MPDRRRKTCTCCGRHERECGPISWTGNCAACAVALQVENIVGISERRGPAHVRRLRGIAKWLEQEALDAGMISP